MNVMCRKSLVFIPTKEVSDCKNARFGKLQNKYIEKQRENEYIRENCPCFSLEGTWEGVEVQLHSFLTTAQGDEWTGRGKFHCFWQGFHKFLHTF
jgi:hypothetical protein